MSPLASDLTGSNADQNGAVSRGHNRMFDLFSRIFQSVLDFYAFSVA